MQKIKAIEVTFIHDIQKIATYGFVRWHNNNKHLSKPLKVPQIMMEVQHDLNVGAM